LCCSISGLTTKSTNSLIPLQPLAAAEEDHQPNSQQGADGPEGRVGPGHVEFREVAEVHAVDAGQERQRDEDGGDDGQEPS